MGFYLNPGNMLSLYKSESEGLYFVDKTQFLEELIPLVEQGNKHICVTRPRRFGKSIMAAMIGSYFGRGTDSSEVFSKLRIAKSKKYAEHLNRHNVIYIDFSKMPRNCKSYEQYISNIETRLIRDLMRAYPNAEIDENDAVWDALRVVTEEYTGEQFIFVFDEWDCIFHKKFITEDDRAEFTSFLAGLTKGTGYVSLTYMTGILPIAKYSSSSTINHFDEYNMANTAVYSEYFGFTSAEVDELYARYLVNTPNPTISRENLAEWYDGYHTEGNESIYNPHSVVAALSRNELGSYWINTGKYSELSTYIVNDIDGVRDSVILLIAGEALKSDVAEYAASSMSLTTKEELFSAMVVYGFLNYDNGFLRIPNRELQEEFEKTVRKEPEYHYMRRLEEESQRILRATLEGDTDTIEEALSYVHNTESPLLAYNDEAELSGSIKLAYIAARNRYDMQREDQAGTGFVDYIFYPYNRADDGIIIELKVDDSAENAIQQIKDRQYALKFQGKIGEQPRTTGRIIAVGIGYYKKDKIHHCRIEVL